MVALGARWAAPPLPPPTDEPGPGEGLGSVTSHGGVLRAAVGTIATASAAPYGYTVSLWSSGALLTHFHGVPGVAAVFLFLAGALLGWAMVGACAHGALRTAAPISPGPGHVVTGLLHWFAVGAAAGVVALLAPMASSVAWLLGSFCATLVFMLCASLQLAIVTGLASGRVDGTPPAPE